MDFTPTEEQEAVRGLASSLLATGTAAEVGLTGFDEALWARLGESGLLGMALPEEVGGGGLGLAEASVVAEETGRAAGRVPVVATLTALPVLAGSGRHGELVEQAIGGGTLVVPALAEHGVHDPRTPSVTAKEDGDGFMLTGTRVAVAWAREASHLVVSASTEDGTPLLALVATPGAGIVLEDEVVSSGEPHATVLLDGVRIAADDVLATGADALEAVLTLNTLLICAHAVGVAEQALALAASHVSTREQFGKPLATFQAVTCRVADCWIDVEAMRLTMQQAVWRTDEGLPAAEQTAIAAFWAAEGVQRVTSAAVHLHGGLGVDVSFPLHRWFLAGKVDELSLGGALRSLEHLGALIASR